MIRTKCIPTFCEVIEDDVILEANYVEFEGAPPAKEAVIEGCDSPHRCGVKQGNGFQWEKCPYHNKKVEI